MERNDNNTNRQNVNCKCSFATGLFDKGEPWINMNHIILWWQPIEVINKDLLRMRQIFNPICQIRWGLITGVPIDLDPLRKTCRSKKMGQAAKQPKNNITLVPNVYVPRKSQHCAIHKYTQGEGCLKSKKIENHTNKEISGFAFFVGVVRVFAGLQAFVCLSSLGSKSCRTAQTKS